MRTRLCQSVNCAGNIDRLRGEGCLAQAVDAGTVGHQAYCGGAILGACSRCIYADGYITIIGRLRTETIKRAAGDNTTRRTLNTRVQVF